MMSAAARFMQFPSPSGLGGIGETGKFSSVAGGAPALVPGPDAGFADGSAGTLC